MDHYSKKLIYFLVVSGFMFGSFNFAAGEGLNLNLQPSLNLNPLDAINKAGMGVNIKAGDVLDVFKLNLPFDLNKVNIDTNMPLSPKVNESQQTFPDVNLKQFLTPKDISSDDMGKAVKAIATLVIEIFLVVISITSQILKLVLGVLR